MSELCLSRLSLYEQAAICLFANDMFVQQFAQGTEAHTPAVIFKAKISLASGTAGTPGQQVGGEKVQL